MEKLRHRISIKSIAAMIAMILLSSVATAQSYSIRVTYNTNLRASYSLQARIVDSASAGVTLDVTGSHENWLKIDWQGREAWMADWVPFTRVQSETVAADVNNCCFVDRQCATDQEWTDGYWAYQNNQCGAPTTPATSISPPMTTAPDQADNCCFLGWNCQSDQDWQEGFMANQANQCQHRGLEIEGPDSFVAQLYGALDLMQNLAPGWYDYVTSGLSKILYDPNARRSAVYSRAATWRIPPAHVDTWSDKVLIIGSLAHEACHVHRYRSGQEYSGLIGERACLEIQIAAVRAVYPTGREWYIDWGTDLLANIENPEFQWWH